MGDLRETGNGRRCSTVPLVPELGRRLGDNVVPFQVFDQQDSGCIAWGVEADGERLLVKYARKGTQNGLEQFAVDALRDAVTFHTAVRHPSIVPVLRVLETSEGPALVYPWVEGEVLSSPDWPDKRTNPASPYSRFLRLPVAQKLSVLDTLIDAHRAVVAAGYIAVDFYLGCILYDFDTDQVHLIDFDHYHLGPYVLNTDRQMGSRSLMPPEEFQRGARIDTRATIYTLGKIALEFLGNRERVSTAWQGPKQLHDVVHRATEADPDHRYPSFDAFHQDWRTNR